MNYTNTARAIGSGTDMQQANRQAVAPERRDVEEGFDALQRAISGLLIRVDELHDRLSPALVPIGNGSAEATGTPTPVRSPIGETLQTKAGLVLMAEQRLADILQRLAI